MVETLAGDVTGVAQTAGQVAPGVRIGGDTSGVEKLGKLRIYELGDETIYTTREPGVRYEVHASAGRITRAYLYYSLAPC